MLGLWPLRYEKVFWQKAYATRIDSRITCRSEVRGGRHLVRYPIAKC